MRMIRNVRRKARCYQNHRKEEWVGMRNIPIEFSITRSRCSGNEKNKL
jgi:hypothetical protein